MTAMRSLMPRTTARSCATKRYARPRSRCRSFSRLRICAWIETSSAETGSSQTISRGFSASAREPDALPLPAGELVRIPVREVGVEADRLEQVADAALAVAARPLAVDEHRLLDDLPDRHARVERRVRILEDDLHLLAQLAQVVPARRRQLVAHEADGAAGRLQQL